ncbi:MAG: glycosyltransferase [Clostridia bacterium]
MCDTLISIIVPVYNQREFLPECVQSLQKQTYANLEILLIDDGSTDGSGELCDAWARGDARIIVHHQANAGVSTARNWGLRHAHGQWIGFVDGDDWVEPAMYEWLLAQAAHHGTEIAACGMEEFFADGSRRQPCKPTHENKLDAPSAFCGMLKGDHFNGGPCNKLYSTALIAREPFTEMPADILSSEDLLFNALLFAKGAALCYEPRPLYHYRIHAQSAMRTFDVRRRTAFLGWQRVVALAEQFDPQTLHYAKAMYCQMAAIYRVKALEQHQRGEARFAKHELGRYQNALLTCSQVSRRTKLRFALMVCCPQVSDRLWKALRSRLHLQWTAGEQ